MITEKTQHAALVTDWEKIESSTVDIGIKRQMIVGTNIMVCRFTFDPFVVTDQHTHPHEQVTLVVKGKVKFTISGEERIVGAGDVLHFPPNNKHGATMLDEEVVLIDIFSPIREDFLNGRKP
ncbi:MAG: cupin domain-containing protein [Pyrinomonadaceae bacterium]